MHSLRTPTLALALTATALLALACDDDPSDDGTDLITSGEDATSALDTDSTSGSDATIDDDTAAGVDTAAPDGLDACTVAGCEELGLQCGDHPDGCGGTLSCGTCAAGTCTDGACVAAVEMAGSVSQYGITWTFDQAYPVGRFVTGDWWVVGPVTVTAIDPAPTGERNGSMLDPVGDQAYDARGGAYDGTRGIALPLAIDGAHSVVSAISHPETAGCQQGGANGWETYDGNCQRGPIATQAVLTVLSEAPPADAFRPPYAGTEKPVHTASSICWTQLPTLSGPTDLPDGAAMLRHVERPWIDHLGSWQMQHGCATQNMYCYGREIGDIVSTLAAYVLLDTPEREDLAMRLVQLGIDNWGVSRAGGGWGADGGHFNGRKFPIVFAGGLLGDPAMLDPGSSGLGNEDLMTYLGTDGDALWGRECSSCYLEAGCQYAGACSNGAKDCRDPAGEVDACDDYRNCCTSRTWVGEATAIRAMGLESAWGHDPFFAYVERWMSGGVAGGGGTSNALVTSMYESHWASPPAGSACP